MKDFCREKKTQFIERKLSSSLACFIFYLYLKVLYRLHWSMFLSSFYLSSFLPHSYNIQWMFQALIKITLAKAISQRRNRMSWAELSWTKLNWTELSYVELVLSHRRVEIRGVTSSTLIPHNHTTPHHWISIPNVAKFCDRFFSYEVLWYTVFVYVEMNIRDSLSV